ncbi:MAG: hypothetical protein GWP09_02535, partial [Nitrospiraceae bacterium]|nr:hypothetical protein [Nitrospiraceae bacterium]
TPSSYTYNSISSDQLNQDFTGTPIYRNISGVVTESGTGLSNVTVSLTGSETTSLLTSSTGYYEFSNILSIGSYTITPTKTNYLFTPDTRTYSMLTNDITDADFAGVHYQGTMISGVIVDTDTSTGIYGVTVSISGSETTSLLTSSTGYYTFTGLEPMGNYTIIPSTPTYSFTPTERTYDKLLNNISDADFSGQFKQFIEINAGQLTALNNTSIVSGDIDNDGDIDLIISGMDSSFNNYTKIYRNDGTGSFTEINAGQLYPVSNGDLALGDIDNDGDLDLILTGYNSGPISKIYQNDGTGSFTEINTGQLTDIQQGSIALGDMDNDGDLDIIICGTSSGVSITKIYQNDGTGSFSEIHSGQLAAATGALALGDIDNDGDLDIILSGMNISNGTYVGKIYQNDGSGSFSEINAGQLMQVKNSTISIGDIDNDGDLDIILTGIDNGGLTYSKIYQNNGTGSFTEINSGQIQAIGDGATALGDINNDGNLDLIISGTDAFSNKYSKIYINNGLGSFVETDTETLIKLSGSSIIENDFDGDNNLDLILLGRSGSTDYAKIYKNNERTINNISNAPANLQASDNGGYWKLSWDAPTDDHSSSNMLRYHIAISTSSSGNYNVINTTIDYPRGQTNIGNVCLAKDHYYQTKIPISTKVYWKVNAIDTSFKVSNYSAENTAAIYIISGVLSDTYGNPIANYPINITGSEPKAISSSSTGFYEYNAKSNNAYITTPDHTYYYSSPSFYSYNPISSNQVNQDFTITLIYRKISGLVTDSTNGNMVPDVTVSLTGSETAALLTSSTGYYEFSSLPSTGTYTITPAKTHYTFSPSSTTYNTLAKDETSTDFDATLNQWAISGTITDGTNPITNVTVSISTPNTYLSTTYTDSSGQYSFNNLDAGATYIITPTHIHYDFIPINQNFVDLSNNVNNIDFTGNIHKWDINGNVVNDSGTSMISVLLSINKNGISDTTTHTNALGNYAFNNLDAGSSYTIIPSFNH